MAAVTDVCGAGNAEQALSLGADTVIYYRSGDFAAAAGRFDLILAVHGTAPIGRYRELLAEGGSYICVGGEMVQLMSALILGPLISTGHKQLGILYARPRKDDLSFLLGLLSEGRIVAPLDRVFPLEETVTALEYASTGRAKGKVVIAVGMDDSASPAISS